MFVKSADSIYCNFSSLKITYVINKVYIDMNTLTHDVSIARQLRELFINNSCDMSSVLHSTVLRWLFNKIKAAVHNLIYVSVNIFVFVYFWNIFLTFALNSSRLGQPNNIINLIKYYKLFAHSFRNYSTTNLLLHQTKYCVLQGHNYLIGNQ